MSRTTRGWSMLLVVGLLVVAGCSRSPEAQKARYLERGDKYAAREQYREAIIEYRNVLRLDPANARATRQLGLLHYQLGESAQAFRYLLKAEELDPRRPRRPAQARRRSISSGASRRRRGEEVTFVLEQGAQEPRRSRAAGRASSTTPEEVDAAIRRLEAARADLGDRAKLAPGARRPLPSEAGPGRGRSAPSRRPWPRSRSRSRRISAPRQLLPRQA